MTETESYDFSDLVPIEIPVKYRGVDYLLVEASEEITCQFQNARMQAAKLGPEGKVTSVKGLADIEPLLVAGCLLVVEGRKPVHPNTIKSWKGKVVKKLYKKALEISELDEDETVEDLLEQRLEIDKRIAKLKEETAKNEPSVTIDTSD